MNRKDANDLAELIVTAQAAALNGHPEFLPGIRLLSLMMTDLVTKTGTIEAHTFHELAALPSPMGRMTFRGRQRRDDAVLDRWAEILEARREDEEMRKPATKRKRAVA